MRIHCAACTRSNDRTQIRRSSPRERSTAASTRSAAPLTFSIPVLDNHSACDCTAKLHACSAFSLLALESWETVENNIGLKCLSLNWYACATARMPKKRACHTPSQRLVPVAKLPDATLSRTWYRRHVGLLCPSKPVPGRRGTTSHGFGLAPGKEAVRCRVVASWHGALRSTPPWPDTFLRPLSHIAHHALSIPALLALSIPSCSRQGGRH